MATEQNVMAAIRTSRPSFRSPQEDKVGYAIHASFLAAGYVLIARLSRRCLLFSFCRVGDYVTENGGSNYSSHSKNLGDLVARVDKEILSKLSGPSTTRPSRVVVPPVYPTIGDTDRFPGAGGGTYPGSGGGMLAGPDHPLFDDRLGGQQPGFLGAPPPVHPPGARFDPFGPPDVPGFEPNRFERDPRRPGGGTHTQISSILVWG